MVRTPYSKPSKSISSISKSSSSSISKSSKSSSSSSLFLAHQFLHLALALHFLWAQTSFLSFLKNLAQALLHFPLILHFLDLQYLITLQSFLQEAFALPF